MLSDASIYLFESYLDKTSVLYSAVHLITRSASDGKTEATNGAPVRDTSKRIDGTDHAHGAFVQDMRVDPGGLDVGVAEKFLHRADVLADFPQHSDAPPRPPWLRVQRRHAPASRLRHITPPLLASYASWSHGDYGLSRRFCEA